jgi:hypothetical protein
MDSNVASYADGLPTKPGNRSPVSIELEDEEVESPPLKSNRVYSGTVSTNNSSEDVLEGVLVTKPSKRLPEGCRFETPKHNPYFSTRSEESQLGKRFSAFLSLAYLSSKCLEINNEHAHNEDLIASHFDERQRRLQKISERLSSQAPSPF